MSSMRKPEYRFTHRVMLAIQGLFLAARRERHMRFHLILSVVVLSPLTVIETQPLNVLILIILLCILLIVELINTAIETTVDLVTRRFSYRAKLAKDTASSAVLIAAGLVVLFSIFIYGPSVYNLTMGVLIGH